MARFHAVRSWIAFTAACAGAIALSRLKATRFNRSTFSAIRAAAFDAPRWAASLTALGLQLAETGDGEVDFKTRLEIDFSIASSLSTIAWIGSSDNLPRYDKAAALNADLGPQAKAIEVNSQVMVEANGKRYTWNDAMTRFR